MFASDTVSGRLARIGDFGPPVEAGAPFDDLAVSGQLSAAVGNDGVESFDVGDMGVDDRLVDDLPEMLGGLDFWRVARQEEKPYSVWNLDPT